MKTFAINDSSVYSRKHVNEFKSEIASYGISIPEEEWNYFLNITEVKTAKKKEVIFSHTELCNHVIYLMSGITATIYSYEDKEVVTRFFQKGNFNTNIVSAESRSLASDILVAITDIEYLLLPFSFFLDSFLNSNTFGLFVNQESLCARCA